MEVRRVDGACLTGTTFLENEVGKRYFCREPATPEEASMMMTTDKDMHRMYFVTEGEVENFFDFPSA